VPAKPVKKIGVLGAGFMGAGVAYVSAQAGIDVVSSIAIRKPRTRARRIRRN